MTSKPSRLREVMGNFATGCTVVTLPGDPPHGITANAFTSVSMDPPLCLISIDHDTTTYEKFEDDVDAFCVNILAESQKDLAEHFASMTELEDDPFVARPTRIETTGAPVFESSLAYVDCTIDAVHPAGDHTLYIGAIESAGVLEEAEPLTFFRGQWGTIERHD